MSASPAVQMRLQRAKALAQQGDLLGALAELEQAPPAERAGVLSFRADLLKAMERFEDALTIRRAQAAAAPQSVFAQHNLAALLGDMGRNVEATEAAERALANGGDAPETWLVLARALSGCARHEAAEAAYRQAVRRRPTYGDAMRELAQLIWMRGGDLDAAMAPVLESLKSAPGDPDLLTCLSVVLMYGGADPRDAWAELTQRAREGGTRAATVELAAGQLALAFDPALATDHARAATELAPNTLDPWVNLAEALIASGDVEGARDILRELLRAPTPDQKVLALHATASRLAGQADALGLDDMDGLVGTYVLDTPPGWPDLTTYLADLRKALLAQHAYDNHPLGQSLRHGAQTPVDLRLVDDPVIRAFFFAIDGPIRRQLARLGRGDDPVRARNSGDYRLNGCWSVRLAPGGFHEPHIHPKGWYSSACYIDVPPVVEAGGREGWLALGQPPFPTPRPLAPLRYEKPEPGKLVLFPSCLWHGTVPFTGDQPRLSVAFDILPA
ncbi:putative 2OG-Fe(II) oxygenase [Brevundimonas guildfordensis]|uniref:Tetratricopeptide repeat protein n=1 Tax=Brevundimonas guildfordensis TaxID=2762241 RepID=A0ABR8QWI8_9CAUL|nr:putative 2OG-Fe(II) oxygenase [Brevundimonas guildfordensis]MBD7939868.1 tetratricopeptide repeat protein [Brevundimonas guildfordensis]